MLERGDHAGVARLVADLNAVYCSSPALWTRDTSPDGFGWIIANDAANNVFVFARYGDGGEVLVCVANFAGVPHENYRLGLPRPGRWLEVINTDATSYGGSGVGNGGHVDAQDDPWHSHPASATLRIPPLGALWLRPETPAA